MHQDTEATCRGCGKRLTLVNRSLDVPGYCGRCAEKAWDVSDLVELPGDMDVASISSAPLRGDLWRLTLIALAGTLSCYCGAILGALTGGRDPMARQASSLQASWVLSMVGFFAARMVFLRRGNALTFARWAGFMPAFIMAYFVTYIPLAILLSNVRTFPMPADLFTFAVACLAAYGAGMFVVVRGDRELRAELCRKCVLPRDLIAAARARNWDQAHRVILDTVAQSHGLVSAEDLTARAYLSIGLEQLKGGARDAALDDLGKAAEIAAASDAVRLKIACALDQAGEHAHACSLLSTLATEAKDRGTAKLARKTERTIRKTHKVRVCCPQCGGRFSGTTDMMGDTAVCPKCHAEFVLAEDQVLH